MAQLDGYRTVEDLCNAALKGCGYPLSIAEIYEGSRASRVALEVYGATRDFLLQQEDWDFALREAALNPIVNGKAILGFRYEYDYPVDALRIRSVHGSFDPRTQNFIPVPNFDPQPVRWVTGNDWTLPAGADKVIFTNQGSATAEYTGQVLNPTTWNPGFTRAFVALLSQIFAFALRDDINLSRALAQMSDATAIEGASVGDHTSPAPPALMARAAAAGRQQ